MATDLFSFIDAIYTKERLDAPRKETRKFQGKEAVKQAKRHKVKVHLTDSEDTFTPDSKVLAQILERFPEKVVVEVEVTVGGTPPIFLIHRFLASDRDLAQAARVIQRDIRDPHMAFRVWQGLLPKSKGGAPRFKYVAPKKGPAAEALVVKMMEKTRERRAVVEDMIALVEMQGKLLHLYAFYGLEAPENDET